MSTELESDSVDLKSLRDELLLDTISTRLKLIIYAEIGSKKQFLPLSEATDISYETWRSWWRKGSYPNGNLIEAACKLWPQYALWLTTGITDVCYGQVMPELHMSVAGYIDNYPDNESNVDDEFLDLSREYLKATLELRHSNKQGNVGDITMRLKVKLIDEIRKSRRDAFVKSIDKQDSDLI